MTSSGAARRRHLQAHGAQPGRLRPFEKGLAVLLPAQPRIAVRLHLARGAGLAGQRQQLGLAGLGQGRQPLRQGIDKAAPDLDTELGDGAAGWKASRNRRDATGMEAQTTAPAFGRRSPSLRTGLDQILALDAQPHGDGGGHEHRE
jgi:hypothetical protein